MGSFDDHSVAYCGRNNGVIGFNMRHKDTIIIIREWEELYWRCTTGDDCGKGLRMVPDEQGNEWMAPNDQFLFLGAIRKTKLSHTKSFVVMTQNHHYGRKNLILMDLFIHQYMRGTSPKIGDKLKKHKQASSTNWKGNRAKK